MKQQETFSPDVKNWKEKQQSNLQIKISHPNIVFYMEF